MFKSDNQNTGDSSNAGNVLASNHIQRTGLEHRPSTRTQTSQQVGALQGRQANQLQTSSLIQNSQPWENYSAQDMGMKRSFNNLVAIANSIHHNNHKKSMSPTTGRSEDNVQLLRNKPSRYSVSTFMLEEIRSYKPFLVPTSSLKRDLELLKFKMYKPFIMQNQLQLELRNGDFLFLGVRISRLMQNIQNQEVQQFVCEKSQIFDEELADIFPVLSQPKILLREFVNLEGPQNMPQQQPMQLQYRLYFGYLIPKFKRTLPLDVNTLNTCIGFKHGLMLLH